VDYILCNNYVSKLYTDTHTTRGLSDHALIYTSIPCQLHSLDFCYSPFLDSSYIDSSIHPTKTPHPLGTSTASTKTHQPVISNTTPARENETIEWVGAGDGDKYMESATKWQEYTASKIFEEAIEQVM
jgi:hypothetical protein